MLSPPRRPVRRSLTSADADGFSTHIDGAQRGPPLRRCTLSLDVHARVPTLHPPALLSWYADPDLFEHGVASFSVHRTHYHPAHSQSRASQRHMHVVLHSGELCMRGNFPRIRPASAGVVRHRLARRAQNTHHARDSDPILAYNLTDYGGGLFEPSCTSGWASNATSCPTQCLRPDFLDPERCCQLRCPLGPALYGRDSACLTLRLPPRDSLVAIAPQSGTLWSQPSQSSATYQ